MGNGHYKKRTLWVRAILETAILGTDIEGRALMGNGHYKKRTLWERAILGTAILGTAILATEIPG